VAFGAPCNSQMSDGSTPLHLAAQNGLLEVCKELVERGNAALTLTNKAKQTAFEIAGSNEVRMYLVEKLKERQKQKEKGLWDSLL